MRRIGIVLAAVGAVALAGPAAVAQTAQPLAKPGCSQPATEPATKPEAHAAAGTSPGSAGSTGWSGSGLGGSHTGTSQAGPVGSSPSYQPVTAKGLDPIKGLATAKPATC